MISAWDVYWVMQLDAIKSTVEWFAWMATFAAAGGAFVRVFRYQDDAPAFGRFAWRAAISACVAAALTSVIPSTKTAAAMILLPAVANNETIHKEAGELYALAKQALTDAVGEDKQP